MSHKWFPFVAMPTWLALGTKYNMKQRKLLLVLHTHTHTFTLTEHTHRHLPSASQLLSSVTTWGVKEIEWHIKIWAEWIKKTDQSRHKWWHLKITAKPAGPPALRGFKHPTSMLSRLLRFWVHNDFGPCILNENVQPCNPRTYAIGRPWEGTIKYSNTATHRLQVFVLSSWFCLYCAGLLVCY